MTNIEELFLAEEETEKLAGEQGTVSESEIVPQSETDPPLPEASPSATSVGPDVQPGSPSIMI